MRIFVRDALLVMVAILVPLRMAAQDATTDAVSKYQLDADGKLTPQSLDVLKRSADRGQEAVVARQYIQRALNAPSTQGLAPGTLGAIIVPSQGLKGFVVPDPLSGEMTIQSVDLTPEGVAGLNFSSLDGNISNVSIRGIENQRFQVEVNGPSSTNLENDLAACEAPSDDIPIPRNPQVGLCSASSVLIKVDSKPTCSGVLISPLHVMTAAHCACPNAGDVNFDLDTGEPHEVNVDVYVGRATGKAQRAVKLAHFFPNAAQGICNSLGNATPDIVMLELEAAFPAHLHEALSEPFVGKDAMISAIGTGLNWESERNAPFWHYGWGLRNLRPEHASIAGNAAILQAGGIAKAGLTILLSSVEGGTATMLEDRKAICPGDSGGGIFRPSIMPSETTVSPLVLVGIVSGIGDDTPCFEGDGVFLGARPVTIARVDTDEIIAWMKQIVGSDLRTIAAASGFGPTILVASANQ